MSDNESIYGPDGPNLDLPFEPLPPGQSVPIEDGTLVAGGMAVVAVTVPTDGGQLLPALLFRFTAADGSGFFAPVLMVGDRDQIGKIKPLVHQSVNAAIRAAS